MTPILTVLPRLERRRKPTADEVEAFYQAHGVRWGNLFAKRERTAGKRDAQVMHNRCTTHAYAKCDSAPG